MDRIHHRAVRYTLVGLELFLVVMAIYGSVSMLVDAASFGLKAAWLQGSPVTDYRVPGLTLLLGVGGTSCLAFVALLRVRRGLGPLLSVAAGLVLVLFEIVELHSIGPRSFQEPLMFVIGLLIAGLGGFLWREEGPRGARGSRLTHAH